MHSCFFLFRSPRRRRQALHSVGGGVTVVVSRGGGEGGVRAAKIVVSRGELERIAAGVTRRQCQCGGAGAAPTSRRGHVVTAAVSLEGQQLVVRAPPRSDEPEEGVPRPALDVRRTRASVF